MSPHSFYAFKRIQSSHTNALLQCRVDKKAEATRQISEDELRERTSVSSTNPVDIERIHRKLHSRQATKEELSRQSSASSVNDAIRIVERAPTREKPKADVEHRDAIRNNTEAAHEHAIEDEKSSYPPTEPTNRPTRIARPVTARAPPPKSKRAQQKAEETRPIIHWPSKQDSFEEKEGDYFVMNEVSHVMDAFGGVPDDAHGSLVREIMQMKLEETDSSSNASPSKETSMYEREVLAMKHVLAKLCDGIPPLASSLDYIQEDFEAMKLEHERWCAQRQSLEEQLHPSKSTPSQIDTLKAQVSDTDHQIESITEEIRAYKAQMSQNSQRIQFLLQHVMNPAH